MNIIAKLKNSELFLMLYSGVVPNIYISILVLIKMLVLLIASQSTKETKETSCITPIANATTSETISGRQFLIFVKVKI